MNLPIYKLVIEDGDQSGVDFVSLVDDPAIQIGWKAFNNSKPLKFTASNTEQKIISGPAMVADLPIYRRDNERGEYLVVFDKDTIWQIVQKFFRNGFTSNVNAMHSKDVQGVFIVESFIIDSKRGIKTPEGYDELPDGSWFLSMKVDSESIWDKFIKTGEFTGFSVEGIFGHELLKASRRTDPYEVKLQTIIDLLKQDCTD